jgi:hypothetical protein
MTLLTSEPIPAPLAPDVDELAINEIQDFEGIAKGFNNEILEQKKIFRPFLFKVLVGVIVIFYILAIILVIGIFIALLRCLGDVPHGVLLLLGALCITPTALLILSVKALFSESSSLDGLSAIGELAKECIKLFQK